MRDEPDLEIGTIGNLEVGQPQDSFACRSFIDGRRALALVYAIGVYEGALGEDLCGLREGS